MALCGGDRHPQDRFSLTVDGSAQPGGGTAAEQSDLPPPPRGVSIKAGDGQLTVNWEPVPEALFYNIYYKTSRGVTKEGKEFDRFQYDAVGIERFKTKIGVTKENGTLVDTAAPPYRHTDLANGLCYHYVITAVTKNGESEVTCAQTIWFVASTELVRSTQSVFSKWKRETGDASNWIFEYSMHTVSSPWKRAVELISK